MNHRLVLGMGMIKRLKNIWLASSLKTEHYFQMGYVIYINNRDQYTLSSGFEYAPSSRRAYSSYARKHLNWRPGVLKLPTFRGRHLDLTTPNRLITVVALYSINLAGVFCM